MKTLFYIGLVLIVFISTPLSISAQQPIKNAKSANTNVWDDFGILMVNLLSDKSTPVWLFDTATTTIIEGGDTALIKGRITQFGKPKRSFQLDMRLSVRKTTRDSSNPAYGFVENTTDADWHYYDALSGTLTGVNDDLKGVVLELSIDDNRPSFQIGKGASQILEDTAAIGCAGWFKWKNITPASAPPLPSGLAILPFPQRSPILDRGGVHFVIPESAKECNDDVARTTVLKILKDNENGLKCSDNVGIAAFVVEGDVNEINSGICSNNNITRLIIKDNKGRLNIDRMMGSIDIKDFTAFSGNTEYSFRVGGNTTSTSVSISQPLGRNFKADIKTFAPSGDVKIGGNTFTVNSDESFVQKGMVGDDSPDANKQAVFARLKLEKGGDKQTIFLVFLLDELKKCPSNISILSAQNTQLDLFATADNTNARLEWVNNTGDKNDYFVVQKADENGDFKDIEFINGEFKGATKYFSTYDYHTTEGENLYRLKLVLFNGAYKYSDIQTVKFEGIKDVRLSPNPADDNLHIDLKNYNDTPVSVFMYNAFGKTVLSKINTSNHVNSIDLDTSSLQTGQYFVRITAKNKRDVLKKIMIVK
jgi:hypothetical protein